MLEAIVENTITNETEYLYLKNENNNLIYYGFCIQNSNVSPINKNIINKIYNLMKVNDSCIYIENYLDYKVYLDKESNIKHYLKNGIEDFLMLFKNNGEDLNIYSMLGDEIKEINTKKFRIKNFIIDISLSALLAFNSVNILCQPFNIYNYIELIHLQEGTLIDNYQYDISKLIYSISEYINLDLKCIDCDEAINLINSSKLPLELKDSFSNQALFKDVFPYYKNTNMEYIVKYRLEDLKLRIYEPTDSFITDPNTTIGFYNELVPYVLNVKNGSDYNEVAKHEFIHLLQSPNNKYMFLREAVAEIAASEYLDKPIESYSKCILNVSLLMDTIGPKIIWETVFSGDDTNLKNVLKNNLSENEYNEFISYLKSRPTEKKEDCERINCIISNLYRNINFKELCDDENIYNKLGFRVKRIYFNEDKMKDNGQYFNLERVGYKFIPINEIFPDQTVRIKNDIVK